MDRTRGRHLHDPVPRNVCWIYHDQCSGKLHLVRASTLSCASLQWLTLGDSLAITFILWIAAAAAITESLGGGLSCSHQNFFAYCGQINAVEGFAWLIWCVALFHSCLLNLPTHISIITSTPSHHRILVTITLIMVIIRGIAAARSGAGYGGGLVGNDNNA
jgi:hypothetical protein